MRKQHLVLLFMGMALLAVAACAGPRRVEGPVVSWSETQMAKLRERSTYWRSYRATLHVTAETEKGKVQRLRTLVLAVPPDRFRLEAMSPFGSTIGLLLLEPSGSSLWVPSEKVLLTADRPETLVQQAIGVPLPVEAFAYSLAAAVPPDQLKDAKAHAADHGFELVAKEPRHGWIFSWYFLESPFALKRLTVQGDKDQYTITYDPPVDVDTEQTPKRIGLVAPDWHMDVKVDQMVSAPALQEAAFRANIPEGVRRIDLDHGKWKGKDL